MSDAPYPTPAKKGVHVYICQVPGCDENAYFGFNTRDGTNFWTCSGHQTEGRKVGVPPGPMKRVGAG